MSGKGPVFLNVRTYRFTGHYVGDPQVYRDKTEARELAETHDPIDRLRARLGVSDDEFAALDERGAGRGRRVGRVLEGRHRPRTRRTRSQWVYAEGSLEP